VGALLHRRGAIVVPFSRKNWGLSRALPSWRETVGPAQMLSAAVSNTSRGHSQTLSERAQSGLDQGRKARNAPHKKPTLKNREAHNDKQKKKKKKLGTICSSRTRALPARLCPKSNKAPNPEMQKKNKKKQTSSPEAAAHRTSSSKGRLLQGVRWRGSHRVTTRPPEKTKSYQALQRIFKRLYPATHRCRRNGETGSGDLARRGK